MSPEKRGEDIGEGIFLFFFFFVALQHLFINTIFGVYCFLLVLIIREATYVL